MDYTGETVPVDISEKGLTPAKRRQLIFEAVKHETPGFGCSELELPTDVLSDAFPDILINDWCKAVQLGWRINTNPLEEFRSRTTIIFWELPEEPDDTILPYEDDEL